MKTKHTPGPWYLSYPIGHDVLIRNSDSPYSAIIASVNDYNNDLDRQEANAKLITAAPELLEICKKVLIHLDVAEIEKGLQYDLKLAIKKATS